MIIINLYGSMQNKLSEIVTKIIRYILLCMVYMDVPETKICKDSLAFNSNNLARCFPFKGEIDETSLDIRFDDIFYDIARSQHIGKIICFKKNAI